MSKLEKIQHVHPVETVKKAGRIKQFVPNAVTTRVARQVLVTQKHSPTLLFAAGIVGVVGTTVLACRATLKVEGVLEDLQKDISTAKEVAGLNREDYSEKDLHKDLAYLYVRGTVKLVKLYGPSFILGVTSIGALAGAHNILSKRNVALTAAYAAVEKGFAEYRQRVVNEFGEDKERELRYSAEERTYVEDTKQGPKKVHVKHVGPKGASIYARFFDDNNQNWVTTPEYNLMFIRIQQNWANDRLRARGHMFLNEVYDLLGMDHTKEGSVVGWIWNSDGDNFIDFGAFSDRNMDRFHDFVTGREGAILLDFNVDGVIYDKI